MKHLILIFWMLLSINSYAQSYKHLSRAETLIEKDRYLNKALRHLKAAEKADYGWCGNATFSAFWRIRYLRATVYLRQGKIQESLTELDSIQIPAFGDREALNELKLEILSRLYAPKRLKQLIVQNARMLPVSKDFLMERKVYVALDSIGYELVLFAPPIYRDPDASTKEVREVVSELKALAILEE